MSHTSHVVHVADLQDQHGHARTAPVLYCRVCGETYSAHRGDYFMLEAGHVFRCCGRACVLVTKHTWYREVEA
jgi:hypothetical protein